MSWISVDERLPECPNGVSSHRVLVTRDCGEGSIPSMTVTFAWSDNYVRNGERWFGQDGKNNGYRVTHWMELPEFPEA